MISEVFKLLLMYITNNHQIAKYAQSVGVDRVFIDLEYIGKKERQGSLDTVISNHSFEDITSIRKVIDRSQLLVRINPINAGSKDEINEVIERGADIIMLPMFTTPQEIKLFISYVDKRVTTCLLLETPQAFVRIDEILKIKGIDEIFIGLNDLSLGMGLNFMFELLSGGVIDYISKKIRLKGIRFGFGGIARLNSGLLPAELILSEHYRLGSEMVILSREFHGRASSLKELQQNIDLENEIEKIRNYENELLQYNKRDFGDNHKKMKQIVNRIIKNKLCKTLMHKPDRSYTLDYNNLNILQRNEGNSVTYSPETLKELRSMSTMVTKVSTSDKLCEDCRKRRSI
jgi:2-keto-3-deoxy-L-rhamnonate aldolase RhmA